MLSQVAPTLTDGDAELEQPEAPDALERDRRMIVSIPIGTYTG